MIERMKLLWTRLVNKNNVKKIIMEIVGLIVMPAPLKVLKWLKWARIFLKINLLRRSLMDEKTGVKETADVADFLVSLINAVIDGFQIGDSQVLLKLPQAIDGIKSVPEELKDLTTDEMRDVIKPIVEKLELPNDNLELAIEYLVMAVIGFAQLMYLKKKAVTE